MCLVVAIRAINNIISNLRLIKYTMLHRVKIFKKSLYYVAMILLFAITNGCGNGGGGGSTAPTSANHAITLDASSGGVANNATNVPLNPAIALKFASAMEISSINQANVVISDASNGSNPVAISQFLYNKKHTVFHFSTLQKLSVNTIYYVIVKNTQTSSNVIENAKFSFTTGSSTAPTVSMVNPENNAIKVSNTVQIQILFSQDVIGVNSTNVQLHESSANGPTVAITSITESAATPYAYTITFATPLDFSSTYYLTLNSGITNTSTVPLAPTTFNFTTARTPILYITNYSLDTVTRCFLQPDGTPYNCMDSGVGAIFKTPQGIAVHGSTAYIASGGINSLFQCTVSESGEFSNCFTRSEFLDAIFGVVYDPNNEVLYISGQSYLNGSSTISQCLLKKDGALFDCYQSGGVNGPLNLNSDGTILYVADSWGMNNNGQNVSKCSIDNYGFIINCVDSGAGTFPERVMGVAVNNDNTIGYIAMTLGKSAIYACQIDQNGNFGNCVKALDNYALGRMYGNGPAGIVLNKYNDSIYIAGTNDNSVLQCTTLNNNYNQLFCAKPTMLMPTPLYNQTSALGITIRY